MPTSFRVAMYVADVHLKSTRNTCTCTFKGGLDALLSRLSHLKHFCERLNALSRATAHLVVSIFSIFLHVCKSVSRRSRAHRSRDAACTHLAVCRHMPHGRVDARKYSLKRPKVRLFCSRTRCEVFFFLQFTFLHALCLSHSRTFISLPSTTDC